MGVMKFIVGAAIGIGIIIAWFWFVVRWAFDNLIHQTGGGGIIGWGIIFLITLLLVPYIIIAGIAFVIAGASD